MVVRDRPGLHPDEPILADFLSVGGGLTTGLAPTIEAPGPEAMPAPDPGQQGQGSPLEPGFRERRLVASALQPGQPLQQAPMPARPSRLPVDPGGLRRLPQALPQLFAPTFGASAVQRILHKKEDMGDRSRQLQEVGDSGGSTSWEHPISPLRSLRPQALLQLPISLREELCRFIFGRFVQEATFEGRNKEEVLTKETLQELSRLRHSGQVAALILLLARLEQRSSQTSDESAVPTVLSLDSHGEQAILGLFLDGQLSWQRAQEHLRREGLPPSPARARSTGSSHT